MSAEDDRQPRKPKNPSAVSTRRSAKTLSIAKCFTNAASQNKQQYRPDYTHIQYSGQDFRVFYSYLNPTKSSKSLSSDKNKGL
ncbi:hypothetical protein MHYP_G00283260 [Metynnis hypsauchen]